ncbi:exosortase E/protease, VPEID-CTERM system [Rubellimicrobium arenae]|uniref:exosortase E/protease, VPEID-CTERM system n=1 Tax=Rubellimicrobium arenae TaxID=2817372 RepID=UPI001B30883A|nr:exosortase E/protease, VPEID-CTERM system [Rubellimicrobium arenae]
MVPRVNVLAGLLACELGGLVLAYQFLIDLDCTQVSAELACGVLRSLLGRATAVLLALSLFVWSRPPAWRQVELAPGAPQVPAPAPRWVAGAFHAVPALSGPSDAVGPAWRWMLLHFVGLALLVLPLIGPPGAASVSFLWAFALPWVTGASLAAVGAMFWAAPRRAWGDWLRREGRHAALVGAAAALLLDLTNLVLPLWAWMPLSSLTFAAVQLCLSVFGSGIYLSRQDYIIGLDGFYVNIGQACSGLEGLLLITAFVVLYGGLFRNSLRFPHYWLVMLPLGLMLSWTFNVLRITALILIGAWASPELAVNGFHSYAGWMFFTLLALALIGLAHATPALQARPERPLPSIVAPSLRKDWLAARILPLSVFLLTGTVGSALTMHPDLAFPFRALGMALVLGFFWPSYRHLRWSRDPVVVMAGGLVAVLWILTEPEASETDLVLGEALSGLGGVALAIWVGLRILGTAVLVPMVEELFFRGYLVARFDLGGRFGQAFAIGASSVLFAVLHGRWLEAWLAGVAFAWVMLRRNNLADAIVAHAVANGMIALWAASRGDWSGL